MRLFPLIAVFVVCATQAAAQTDLARCEQTTVQFPQACPCIIEGSEAAGITGQTLSQLLVNNTDGVPIDTFQAYGAIFVQCIQSAVLAGVPAAPVPPAAPAAPSPAAPSPAAPSPVVPAQTPAPAGADIPGPPVLGPVQQGLTRGWRQGEVLTIFIREDRPAGIWGGVSAIRGAGRQTGGVGVHDGAGRILMLGCQPPYTAAAPYMALIGLGAPVDTQRLQITVLRGNGQQMLQTYSRAQSTDGAVLVMPVYFNVANALRGGSMVRFTLDNGQSAEFGLRGSSAALGSCGSQPPQRWQYLAQELFAPDGEWTKAQMPVVSRDALPDDVLVHTANAPLVPSIALTCDRRLAVRSAIFGYGATERAGVIETPSTQIPLRFSPQGALDMASQPLTDAEIAALSAASTINIAFDLDMDPGDGTGASYPMDGFAGGLASLTCPAPAGPLGPVARIDASGQQNAWEPADIGFVFDGMSGNPPYTPGAFFTTDQPDVPTLGMQCNGEPFVVDPWPGPRFTVRMEVDGTAQEIEWFSSRAHYFPDYLGNEAFFNGILNGAVLRMTLTTDTRLDVAYSLDGLRQALSAAGCP